MRKIEASNVHARSYQLFDSLFTTADRSQSANYFCASHVLPLFYLFIGKSYH